ncbi:MAG: alpha-glucosidase [Bacteroidetes bacterium]|nr:alpha-glucosidase [Bacteroidota bacterium]
MAESRISNGLRIDEHVNGFIIYVHDRKIIDHSTKKPCIEIGSSEPKVESKSGFFKIREGVLDTKALRTHNITTRSDNKYVIELDNLLTIVFELKDNLLTIEPKVNNPVFNRFRIHLCADPKERIYGGGEQLGKLNLKGTTLPVWISEPGVGRRFDPLTISFAIKTGHIPRWFNTYYSMPSWVSSSGLYGTIGSTAYSELNFKNKHRHSLYCWEIPEKIVIGVENTLQDAVSGLSKYLGRQPKLPSWVYDGLLLGVQGGRDIVLDKLNKVRSGGADVAAVWCQDWEGRRKTKFGSQLKWAWEYDNSLYPDLPDMIKKLKTEGVRYLGYNNTFLTPGSKMYDEAVEKGYIIKKEDGSPYFVYVPFDPAVLIDFTNPEAVTWLKDIIRKNMIDIGLSGWMADFGEMIPHDAVLSSGESGLTYHNKYPVEWAKLNAEVVEESGKKDDLIYFMRAGFAGASKYTSMNWNGDQLVDWTKADGLPSAIMGSLSMGMSGLGYTHSDIGGYTTLGYKKRGAELLMRWAEYSAFTQTMRSHEGNRPDSNVQIADDDKVIKLVARMVKVFKMLKPYNEKLSEEYQKKGLPPQRIPAMHFPDESAELSRWPYQYMYGSDLLVAPVIKKGKRSWRVRLPREKWIHLWSGKEYAGGGIVTVNAPIGEIPVFYRTNSDWKELFEKLRSL